MSYVRFFKAFNGSMKNLGLEGNFGKGDRISSKSFRFDPRLT